MKKIVSFLALLSFFSCAAVTQYQKIYRAELQQRDNELFGPPAQSSLTTLDDTSLGLLLGLYAFSLAKNPPEYPLYPYSPYLFSLYYPFDSFHDLMVYESKLQSINNMETWKLQLEVQRILDDLERATDDAKYKLENTIDDLEETTEREEERLEEAARKLENERWQENHKRTLNYLLVPEKKATFGTTVDELLEEMYYRTFGTHRPPNPKTFDEWRPKAKKEGNIPNKFDITAGLPSFSEEQIEVPEKGFDFSFLDGWRPQGLLTFLSFEAEATGAVGAGAVATTQAPELRKRENLKD